MDQANIFKASNCCQYSRVNSLIDFPSLLISMTQQSSPPKPYFPPAIYFHGTSVFLGYYIILQCLSFLPSFLPSFRNTEVHEILFSCILAAWLCGSYILIIPFFKSDQELSNGIQHAYIQP